MQWQPLFYEKPLMISSYSLLQNKNSHLKFSEELYIHEARDNLVVYFDCIYIYIYHCNDFAIS